ncbi:MAG: lysoplasmalogenase [Bacteroidales bacterium]|nr:lysoplasmalogenase [Bacteroidales bacterium]
MKNKLFAVAVTFYGIACLLNVGGWIWAPALSSVIKPALMPLLALSVLAYVRGVRMDARALALLVTAQLCGWAGDTLLLGEPLALFASGLGMFFIGHFFYFALFGPRAWKGMSLGTWIISVALMVVIVAVLIRLMHIEGVLLIPIAIYGIELMLLIFSGLCGFVRVPGERGTWLMLLCGAVLFTFSDSLIAAQMFGVLDFFLCDFTIMLTYLAAQSLLAIGTIRLYAK